MVNKIKLFRQNTYIYIPITDWFEEHYKELPKETIETFAIISDVFQIKTIEDYKKIYDYLWVDFNYHKILIKYEELINMNLPFDEDIIKFIAFLYGTDYFIKIGYPDINIWLNAKDFNHPFEDIKDKQEGFSLFEAVKYEFGQNAVRSRLLSTLKWLGSQSG